MNRYIPFDYPHIVILLISCTYCTRIIIFNFILSNKIKKQISLYKMLLVEAEVEERQSSLNCFNIIEMTTIKVDII